MPQSLRVLAGLVVLAVLGGCSLYMPRNVDEQIRAVKEAGGSGCIYLRGNSRPYADVSVVMVSTVGKGTDYRDCLTDIAPEARDLRP